MCGREPAPNRLAGAVSAGPLSDVSEVFALVRSFGGRLNVLQLRRDLIDLFRLVLELVEGDLETQVFREDVQDGLRALRIDEVTGRLPHQAHRLHVIQAAESSNKPLAPTMPAPASPRANTTPYFSISFTRSAP